jgi:sugar lactone lactonase YvrE
VKMKAEAKQLVLLGAVLLLAAADTARSADDGRFANRVAFATPAAFADCFRDGGIAVGGPAGPVALAESELLVDHVGNRLAGKPAFSAAMIGKKVFRLDGPPGRAARLYVFGGGTGSFNGRPLPAGSKVQTGGWTEFAIDSAWLEPGDNEAVFTGGQIALDAEASPARHSFTSRDGGTTWEPAAGEFLARLRLDRFAAGGVVTSDVIDVTDDGKAAIRPLVAIDKLVVTCSTQTPPGTSIALEARSGHTPRPDASWTGWVAAATVPPARHVQWRAALATSDRGQTPVLEAVTVEAGGTVKAATPTNLEVEAFENHAVVRGSHPYEFQRPGEKLARLRRQWKLDELVAAGKTDLERLLLLRNWVRRQWPCNDSGSGSRTWDAIEILSAGPDQHGMCVHFATAFYQCALALGYVARPVILANHFVADVWSNEAKGWVLMDVEATHAEGFRKYGTAHYLCSGDRTPLGALEIHRRLHRAVAAKAAKADDIIQVYAVDTDIGPHVATDVVRPVEELMTYARFCLPPRNNYLDKLVPWEEHHGEDHYHSDMYLWWQGPEPAGVPPEYSRRTNRTGDIDWTVNTVEMSLTATERPDEVAVTLDTVTPNFKAFVYRFNDGPWQTTAGDGSHPDERTGTLSWKLAPGKNTIEVQPRNAFDRDGVASRATILVSHAKPASVVSDLFLKVPQNVRDELGKGAVPFVMAKAAPRVELMHHGDLPEAVPSCLWSAWGDICVADDGTVYVGTGDHGLDAEGKAAALLYVYDPRDGILRKVADLNAIVPRGEGEPAWSKLHAGITQGADGMIYFTGTLNDGSLALDTARYHWSAARPGGQLFRYDPRTGKSSLVLNLPGGRCTATAVMDRERNIWWCNLEGRVGKEGIDAICAIDLATQQVLLRSPDGSSAAMNRNFALGRDGCAYFNGVDRTIWKADPRSGKIAPTRSVWQPQHAGMRASTAESKDGWIYGCTHTPGHLFRYSPTKDVLEMLGPDFLHGEYTTVCVLSPDERFVYYMPGAHGRAYRFGTPLVQYEIATGIRKVIAFLAEPLESACGYVPGGTYGVKISADGSTIYANLNGHPAASSAIKTKDLGFGLTSFAVIHIPPTER